MEYFSVRDLVFYGIVAAIYFLRGKTGKRIAVFVSIAYSSFMCCATLLETEFIFTVFYTILGIASVGLLYKSEGTIKAADAKLERSKTLTAVLSWFLGAFGAHRFYLGELVVGAVYLMFWWTLIPLFISLFEGVMFLIMPKDKFDKKYNQSKIHAPHNKENDKISSDSETTNADASEETELSEETDDPEETKESIDIQPFELPVGMCSITGKPDDYKIRIVSRNGQIIVFNVIDDGIVSAVMNEHEIDYQV